MAKPTIHDVAVAAGVGVATVDRVLNNRPGVRGATRDKVREAMRTLGYRPNAFAARLSKASIYRFLFLLPGGHEGHNLFFDVVVGKLREAAEAWRAENVFIEMQAVAAFDGFALAGALDELSPEHWDGAAVVTPDLPRVREAIDGCVRKGIKVITLVSDLPSSQRSFYVGLDNFSAGRVAGRLLGKFTRGRPGKLAVIPGSLTLSDHMARFMGCGQVVRSQFPHLEMLPPVEGRDNTDDTRAAVAGLLAEHGDGLVAVYNCGAGNRGLIAAVEESGRRGDLAVIAHELSSYTRQALLDDTIDAVLSQDAEREVERAVTLLRQLCDGETEIRNAFVRTDIFLPDNL